MTNDDMIAIGKSCIDGDRDAPELDEGWLMHADEFIALCRAVAKAEREAIIKRLIGLGALADGEYIAAISARSNQ